MRKPFDALYAGLEKALNSQGRDLAPLDQYALGIAMIREKILELRALGRKSFSSREAEVEFFRLVWPAFYGKLLLYVQLHRFELFRLPLAAESLPALIRREEKRVGAFFRSNREFWMYYRSGSAVLDEQFTRAYSQARVFEPLALVIDSEGATLASYRAAWCVAMEGYGSWLAEERERLAGPVVVSGDYSWGPADTDFVEWLFGLQAVGAILYKGQLADIGRLVKWAKWALGKEVANIHDRFKVLRNRKKERMVFTKKTEASLIVRMNLADGK